MKARQWVEEKVAKRAELRADLWAAHWAAVMVLSLVGWMADKKAESMGTMKAACWVVNLAVR